MWQVPESPANEAARLEALAAFDIMDTPREKGFDRLAWLAKRIYAADVAFVSFMSAEHQWIKSVTSSAVGTSIGRQKSICQVMVATGEPLVVGDLRTDERFEGHPTIPQMTLRFYAGVPLRVEPDLVIGTLCIMRHQEGIEPGFDIEPLEALAAIAVDELELRRLNRELNQLSRVDGLTGLSNRRAFDEELVRAELRCRRTGEALSVMVVDIDHFKALNDGAGHGAGDKALRDIGVALGKASFRRDDTMARYGGDEFAAILVGSDAAGARLVADRLCLCVGTAAIEHPINGQVTLSVGIATHYAHDLDTNLLIEQADSALYAAKRGGRDRVVSYGPPEA
ncbi:sensor domain-containing diguanylate cyclase [Ancylobacter pratisalsi]|uniref:diguanylate cyclase n=1 Tax=Ancylobacter pratisalsi TaxID=1745854 RepID=A0A6P1YH24_9HYPH|nr:sensor domain-containing diguanylate cyclase [Ancylobacter pratisalsi]QIB32587.1 sensor domain-containing diguanylate cyclase [Ancylobacter pratisalsi]